MQDYHKPASLEIINRNREKLKAEGELYKEDAAQRDARTGQTLKIKAKGKRVRGPSWEDPDVADNQLNDGRTADEAIKALQALKGKPFFLACGFLKPHLPFIAPQKYFEPYPLEKVRLAGNPNPPEDVPPPAMTDSGELRAYSDIPDKGPIPAEKARELVRAYYAAASYTDAQIGRVLDELERLGLADDTVVVLWGDHGWHLGEHGLWCKHTNFEVATRSVLLVRAPGRARGERTNALVEFVDIYPTLCELVGLPVPKGLEGASFAPLLKDPARPWKSAAFSQYPRKELMGHSMRTDRYRYTEWADRDGKAAPVGVELYDHQSDPGENVNLANRPECKELAARLAARLHAGWREALPGSKPAESDNAAPAAR
jgi:arylsulfatase A-like enzyme